MVTSKSPEILMAYNYDKYKSKREKVLGVKKRSMSFVHFTSLFTLVFLLAAGIMVLPQAVAFFSNRPLDDVIFRINQENGSVESSLETIRNLPGVTKVQEESREMRIVVTFNRHKIQPEQIERALEAVGLSVVLLNTVGHSQRLKILAEEAKFETL